MSYMHGTTRRADAQRPATGLQALHPPTLEPRPARPFTQTLCRANMRAEDYEPALMEAYHSALAEYAHEPPGASLRRLAEATADANQWFDTKRPPQHRKK